MSNNGEGVADGGAAAGLHAAAGSTQIPKPAATSNDESAASAGAKKTRGESDARPGITLVEQTALSGCRCHEQV